MTQIKRSLSFSQPIDFKDKKSRNELYLLSDRSNNYLENLSNELFYEIFDYLDGCDINYAFSNLNKRFQNLISCSTIPIKIDFDLKSTSLIEYRCQHIIIPNKHRLLSLYLRSRTLIDEFFKFCNLNSSFNHLQSILLSGLTDRKLVWILVYLNSLPSLSSLTVCVEEEHYYNFGDIYRLIFSLSTLNYCKFSLLDYDEPYISIPDVINEQFSSIKYLIIDHCCTVEQLTSLLCHTPHLCSLTCDVLMETDDVNVKRDLPITLSDLRSISINGFFMDFNEFEVFIKKISSQLQVLRISVYHNATFLLANRWEELIKSHMPYLNKFYLKYEQFADIDFDIGSGYTFIDQFTSPFWLQRKWFSELKINRRDLFFSIYPYKYADNKCTVLSDICSLFRKNQFDFDEYMKMDTHLIRFTIEGSTNIEQFQLFTNKMKASDIKTQLTYLNISYNNMSIVLLVEIIRLLPHLKFLEISSLSTVNSNSLLSVEYIKKQLLVSITNKIIKVKLNKLTEKNQIHFLINLCSHIRYLEVGFISNTNQDMLIRYILINQVTQTANLNFVCLNIPNANDNMIKKLTMMIDLETMINNYTIQRIGEKIFLQWKLE